MPEDRCKESRHFGAFARTISVPQTLTIDTVVALRQAVAAAAADPIGAIVLTGDGERFCDGLDLAAILGSDTPPDALIDAFAATLGALRQLGVPTVALVNGAANGGGVGLAAACDLVIASERASFALPELLFGLLPAAILPVLEERLPPQRIRLMALRGEPLSAAEALAHGLADDVVPAERLHEAVRRHLRRLARPRPETVTDWKRMTARRSGVALAVAVADAGRDTAARLADPGLRERLRAYFEEGIAPWCR